MKVFSLAIALALSFSAFAQKYICQGEGHRVSVFLDDHPRVELYHASSFHTFPAHCHRNHHGGPDEGGFDTRYKCEVNTGMESGYSLEIADLQMAVPTVYSTKWNMKGRGDTKIMNCVASNN